MFITASINPAASYSSTSKRWQSSGEKSVLSILIEQFILTTSWLNKESSKSNVRVCELTFKL